MEACFGLTHESAPLQARRACQGAWRRLVPSRQRIQHTSSAQKPSPTVASGRQPAQWALATSGWPHRPTLQRLHLNRRCPTWRVSYGTRVKSWYDTDRWCSAPWVHELATEAVGSIDNRWDTGDNQGAPPPPLVVLAVPPSYLGQHRQIAAQCQ